MIIETGIALIDSLITGIIDALPLLLDQFPIIADKVANALIDNAPKLIKSGIELITKLIDGIVKALPKLLTQAPKITAQMAQKIIDNLPQLIEAGGDIIEALVNGAKQIFGKLGDLGGDVIFKLVNAMKELPSKMLDIGKNAIKGLWNGIKDMKNWVIDKVKGFGKSILNGIKSALGIHSPSTVFKEQVGKNIALGIGEGFSEEMAQISKDMQDEIPTLDVGDISYNSGSSLGGALNYQAMIDAFKEALGQMTVELDDKQVGKFVKKTVSNAIYT